jgi:hypothetical protein
MPPASEFLAGSQIDEAQFKIETKKNHELSISNQPIAALRLLNVRTVMIGNLKSKIQ